MPRKDGYPTSAEYRAEYESGKYQPLVLTDSILSGLYSEILQTVDDIRTEYGFSESPLHPSHWSMILFMISQRIFKPRPELLRRYNIAKKSYARGYAILDNVMAVYSLYSAVSDVYQQRKSLYFFCRFSGLEMNSPIFRTDGHDDGESKRKKTRFVAKIRHDEEESIISLMHGSAQNPVKYIAYLNHFFDWNDSQATTEAQERQLISLSEIPRLELSDNLISDQTDDDDELF